MKKQAVNVDTNLLEKVQYKYNSLPLSFCKDYFDELINGEVNCHWHDEFEFAIILQGEVKYYLYQANAKPQTAILLAGDGVFVNSKTLHMVKQISQGAVMDCFLFPVSLFTFQPTGVVYKKNVQPIMHHSLHGLFFKAEHEEDREILNGIQQFLQLKTNTIGYELLCIEIIYKLWRNILLRVLKMQDVKFPQVELSQEQRIRCMLAYIHTNYAKSITVEDIAKSANISVSECFRCFKKIINKSPIDYLLEYRLAKAGNLLINTGQTVLDISLSCGFNNASYFGKVFKAKTKFTPLQFRKHMRK